MIDPRVNRALAFTYQNPVLLLQQLLRFRTVNPPGNELACLQFVQDVLASAGVPSRLLGHHSARPNLIARLAGAGTAQPLLLHGHVDVVAAEEPQWQYPPFAGVIENGYVWGRGALDMKGGLAMMLSALLRARMSGLTLPGDVIVTLVCDEEAGSDLGAKYLVKDWAHLFDGVKYAIGEFGGFMQTIDGQPFFPIMVAEKQICWMTATFRGPTGHGSVPKADMAMTKLGRMLNMLDRTPLPIHVPPVMQTMLGAIASGVSAPVARDLRDLTSADQADAALSRLGETGRRLAPLLRNTISPTIVQGGEKINVIPAEVTLQLDGRLLPGQTPDDLLLGIRALVGEDVDLVVDRYDWSPAEPDLGWFGTLATILQEMRPDAIPLPSVLGGVTDGRFFARLGIQTYGYLPTPLPNEFDAMSAIHAPNERIPVDSLEFGTQAILTALQRAPA
ncbi:M20/M25/M40 family metallo-hydrolase [Deinococcus frigens]|uniref:M20/M25/M40 family metallo-hydrolase n=1 Tax=Deinococcus frigens TaxID=249403 RepID=UPI00068BF31C|nr:M20/M25/M40 family metallo-hydrolase [Deinococcus frigens]